MKKLILAFILIFCMAFSAHATTEVLYHEWGGYAHDSASIKYVNGVFTNVHDVLDFLIGSGGSTSYYTTAEVDLKLLDKQNVADMVGYYTKTAADILFNDKASTDSVALKADKTYVDSTDENIIALINGLPAATNHNSLSGRDTYLTHPATSLGVNGTTEATLFPSGTTTATVQDAFDTISIWLTSLQASFSNYYTKAETNATIEAAIAAIPTPTSNQTVSVTAGEDLTAGQVVSLINSNDVITAKHLNLAVNTSPNGAESVFNSAATTYCSAVALDSTRFLVAYVKADNKPYAKVGTVSGSSVSWGSESLVLENVTTSFGSAISICKINTDKILACYRDSDNSRGRMVVLTISTNAITVNSPATYSNNSITWNSISTIDTDKAIVCYRDEANGGVGYCKIITVSTTTPTPYPAAANSGTQFDTNSQGVTYISVSSLSQTSAIVAYRAAGTSYGTAQVLSISGTTITPGTEYVFNSGNTQFISVASNSSSDAIIVYRDAADTNDSSGLIATVSNGTEIVYGIEKDFSTTLASGHQSLTKVADKKFLYACTMYDGNKETMFSILLTYSGTTIDTPALISFNSSSAGDGDAWCCYIGNYKSIIVFGDGKNSLYGTSVVNTWATSDFSQVRGIATANITSGNSGTILLNGLATGLTSIVAGSQYWLQSDFTMGTAPVSLAIMKNSSTQTGEVYLGTGASSTSMYFGVDYK